MKQYIEEVFYIIDKGPTLEIVGLFILSVFIVVFTSTLALTFIKTFMGDDI